MPIKTCAIYKITTGMQFSL